MLIGLLDRTVTQPFRKNKPQSARELTPRDTTLHSHFKCLFLLYFINFHNWHAFRILSTAMHVKGENMAINSTTGSQDTSVTAGHLGQDQLGIAPTDLQQTLELAGLLQTTLEINQILGHFLDSARLRVDFDSLHYSYDALGLEFEQGNRKRHSCAYRLKLAGECLGELVFTRRQRFAEEELQKIENLLCQLIYPLRNGIWYQRAVHAIHVDQLTGVHNRGAFDSSLVREIDLAHRNQTPLSLVVADLDNFKRINDEHGHAVGDDVLRVFAETLMQNMRSSDIVYRYGGEEFVILMSNTDRQGAELGAQRLREAVNQTVFSSKGLKIPVTASFGVASLGPTDNSTTLFDKADHAMYEAKKTGRNRVVCFIAEPAKQGEGI